LNCVFLDLPILIIEFLQSAAVIIQPDHLWRVDPTGQFWNCKAACIGRGAGLAETYLIDHLNHELTVEEAISICRDSIENTLPKEKYHWRGVILKKTGSMAILNNKQLSEVKLTGTR
jgi:20S proteasome alpha/beta subunit